jgi:hypothetical protein
MPPRSSGGWVSDAISISISISIRIEWRSHEFFGHSVARVWLVTRSNYDFDKRFRDRRRRSISFAAPFVPTRERRSPLSRASRRERPIPASRGNALSI